jgi:hypothetical protein
LGVVQSAANVAISSGADACGVNIGRKRDLILSGKGKLERFNTDFSFKLLEFEFGFSVVRRAFDEVAVDEVKKEVTITASTNDSTIPILREFQRSRKRRRFVRFKSAFM